MTTRRPSDDDPRRPPTETADRATTGPAPRGRMRDLTHVHRDHDPRAWHWFARGPTVVADGGEPAPGRRTSSDRQSEGGEPAPGRRPSSDRESEADADRDVEDEQLSDVSHEPVHGDGANRVWERGEDRDDDGRDA